MKRIIERLITIRKAIDSGRIDDAISLYENIGIYEDLELEISNDIIFTNSKILLELGEIDQALISIKLIITNINKIDSMELKFRYTVTYLDLLVYNGQIMEAENALGTSVELFQKMNKIEKNNVEIELATLNKCRGLIALEGGEYDLALGEFSTALVTWKKLILPKEEGIIHYNISRIHRLKNNDQLSISFLEKALDSFKSIEYYEGMERVLHSLHELSVQIGDQDSAFHYKNRLSDSQYKFQLKHCQIQSAKNKATFSSQIAQLNEERIELEQKIWSLEFKLNSVEVDTEKTMDETAKTMAYDELQSVRIEMQNLTDIYDTSQADLENARMKIMELENQIEMVKKTKQKIDPDEVVRLQERNKKFVNEITALTTTLEEEASLANRYRIQLNNLNDILDEVEAEKEDLSVKFKSQEKEGMNMDEQNKEVEELKARLKASYTDMKDLKISSQGKSDEIKVLNKHLEEYKNKLKLQTTSEDDVNMYKEKITNLNIFLDDKQKEINELNEKLSSSPDETISTSVDEDSKKVIKELENQVHNYKLQIINSENLNDEILEKESKIKSLNQQNINLQSKIDYIEKQSSEKVEAPVAAKIKTRLKELEDENVILKDRVEDITNQSLEMLETPDMSVLEDRVEELLNINKDLNSQIENLQGEKKQFSQLEDDIKQLKIKIIEKEEEAKSLSRRIDDFNSQISDKDAEITKLKSESAEEKIIEKEIPILPKMSKSKVIISSPSTVEEMRDLIVPTVRPSEVAKTREIERGPMVTRAETPAKPVGKVKHKSIQPSTTNLQEILDGSKLASIVYKILEDTPRIQLTFLAMRIGTSPAKCLEEIENLVKEGFLSVKRKSSDDTNPVILLNN